MLDRLLDPTVSLQILAAAILAICFLQSGIDKLVDFKGNLGWLQGHFAKTPLRGQVLPMLVVVTVLECLVGALCAAGAVQLAASGEKILAMRGVQLAALNIAMLFFGQRIAKDYPGAATLATYFVLTGIAFLLLRLP